MGQVGEKTAIRRRLLNGWQFILQLRLNKKYQNFYRHLFQILIIVLTFTSIMTGVMSYQATVAVKRSNCVALPGGGLHELDYWKSVTMIECESPLAVYVFNSTHDVLFFSFILRVLNVAMPLLNSFMIALNSLW